MSVNVCYVLLNIKNLSGGGLKKKKKKQMEKMPEENLGLDLHFQLSCQSPCCPVWDGAQGQEGSELGLRRMLQGLYLFITFELSLFIPSSPPTELVNAPKSQKYSVPCPPSLF